MRKVLLLNGSHSELMLLNELKKLGYYVIVTGNVPGSFCNKHADKYIQADYSDKEYILKIAKDNNVGGVVSCANDFGIITASYVADMMGLKGYDSNEITELIHQKNKFKEFAIKNKMYVPVSYNFDSFEEALKYGNAAPYPVIIKPIDLTGGKGISKAKNESEYIVAIKRAFAYSRKNKIVVEKFVDGSYHSFSTFLVGGKVIGYFCDNEYSNVYRFFVDTSAGPADYFKDVKDILINQAEFIADKLHLVDGIFHMQYVLDKNKIPYIIDVTRRCSGDLYSEPVEHSTGLPWSKWIVMSELGYEPKYFFERGTQKGYCGRHCIMADREGIVEDVLIDEQIKKYIYKYIQWWKADDRLTNHLVEKLGIIFYEFPDKKTMDDVVSNIKSYVRVKFRS